MKHLNWCFLHALISIFISTELFAPHTGEYNNSWMPIRSSFSSHSADFLCSASSPEEPTALVTTTLWSFFLCGPALKKFKNRRFHVSGLIYIVSFLKNISFNCGVIRRCPFLLFYHTILKIFLKLVQFYRILKIFFIRYSNWPLCSFYSTYSHLFRRSIRCWYRFSLGSNIK